MGDAQPLKLAILVSVVPYIAGLVLLSSARLGKLGLCLCVPLVPIMAWQTFWGSRLFVIVNVEGLSDCTLTTGEPFGSASDDWLEQVAGSYYALVSLGSILGIAHAYRRYRREGSLPLRLEIFD